MNWETKNGFGFAKFRAFSQNCATNSAHVHVVFHALKITASGIAVPNEERGTKKGKTQNPHIEQACNFANP